jgi:hypothetical protein
VALRQRTFVTLCFKLIVGLLVIAALGVPIIATWKALLLAVLLLAIVFGARKEGLVRIAVAATVAATAIAIRPLLPHADIAEAHNAFRIVREGEALERGLPPDVYRSWRAQFEALYSRSAPPSTTGWTWMDAPAPVSLYVQSSDAIWRRAKYTRQVDSIAFHSLGEFRGGFANEVQDNFWAGELLREQMPFYVMYELTPASVGSQLAWTGQLFWQRTDGTFAEIFHPTLASRAIVPADAGKRIYKAFFPKRDPQLDVELIPSRTLRVGAWIEFALSAGAAIAVVVLTITPLWPSFVRAVSIFGAGYVLMAAFLVVSAGKYLGRPYPPQAGGDDGLMHDGWGHGMAILAGHGHVLEALRGFESVYWFTPGTRYVRMVEKLIFGDTNHLFSLLVPCVLIVLFYLARHFLGTRAAWIATAAVCVLPVENISYLQYIANAKLGYGEAIGGAVFLLGLVLLFRTQPAWGGTDSNRALAFVGGTSLAASMFIRPNFAFAVVWLGTAYAWTSWRNNDYRAVAALAGGLAFALWMPLHNLAYGHEFHLISRSGATVSVPLGPRDYAAAVADIVRGNLDSREVATTVAQVRGWLGAEGFTMLPALRGVAAVAHGLKLVALAITVWVAMTWLIGGRRQRPDIGVLAVASLMAHVPMLFIFTTNYRYAMLGWDLSIAVLAVWLYRLPMLQPASGPEAVPV